MSLLHPSKNFDLPKLPRSTRECIVFILGGLTIYALVNFLKQPEVERVSLGSDPKSSAKKVQFKIAGKSDDRTNSKRGVDLHLTTTEYLDPIPPDLGDYEKEKIEESCTFANDACENYSSEPPCIEWKASRADCELAEKVAVCFCKKLENEAFNCPGEEGGDLTWCGTYNGYDLEDIQGQIEGYNDFLGDVPFSDSQGHKCDIDSCNFTAYPDALADDPVNAEILADCYARQSVFLHPNHYEEFKLAVMASREGCSLLGDNGFFPLRCK